MTLRCQTKLHPLRSALRLLFSFHKDSHTLQDRGPHPELCIPGVKEGDSGLYWCEVATEGGQVQKQSPQLEVRVQGKCAREWRRPQGPGHQAMGSPGGKGVGERSPGEEGARVLGGQAEPPTPRASQLLCPVLCSLCTTDQLTLLWGTWSSSSVRPRGAPLQSCTCSTLMRRLWGTTQLPVVETPPSSSQ